MASLNLKKEFEKIVGAGNVFDKEADRFAYSRPKSPKWRFGPQLKSS